MQRSKVSEIIKQTNSLSKFSPNGLYLASARTTKLYIHQVADFSIEQIFTCADVIQTIKWSSDSAYILCGMFKRKVVQVWSIENPQWSCKIDEGSLGLIKAEWSPDGRHILTTARFHMRITIWSLVNQSVAYIKFAKQLKHGLAFSPCGKYMVVAERRDCHDFISIISCEMWELIQNFKPNTTDMGGILWSPQGDSLCIWEAMPLSLNVLLYLLDGTCIGTFKSTHLSMGVKSLTWSPTSQFFAVGSYDQKIRLLNHLTWKPVSTYNHPRSIASNDTNVFQEVAVSFENNQNMLSPRTQFEQINTRPTVIPGTCTRNDYGKDNLKYGIGTLGFSPNGRFLLSINDNMPCVYWIWDLDCLAFRDVVIHMLDIKAVAWHPSESLLAVCTGTNNVYYWTPQSCSLVEIATTGMFEVLNLQWHPLGHYLLVMGKEKMCLISNF